MFIQTIATASYLPFVALMQESVRRNVKVVSFSVLVTDAVPEDLNKIRARFPEDVVFVCCDDIPRPELSRMRKYYNVLEFNSACKVIMLDYQLREGKKDVLFLDPDIYACSDFSSFFTHCRKDILLTPHALAPYPEDGHGPTDMELAVAGQINGGVIYFRDSSISREAAAWLAKKAEFFWFVAPLYGMYADQQWLSLLPYYFPGATEVSRDTALNISYFNLHERQLDRSAAGSMLVDNKPAALFHFSGFAVPSNGKMTCHTDRRFSRSNESVLSDLVRVYEQSFLNCRNLLQDCTGQLGFANQSLEYRMALAAQYSGRSYSPLFVCEDKASSLAHKLKRKFLSLFKRKG